MGKDTKGKVLGGIPQAIDKVIKLEDGSEVRVSYPAWIGKEVAREKMGTDNAGRTSGHDLVFRSENINEISDDVYLSQFYDAKSKEPETPISKKNFLDFIESRAVDYGRLIGVEHGEGFISHRTTGLTSLNDFI